MIPARFAVTGRTRAYIRRRRAKRDKRKKQARRAIAPRKYLASDLPAMNHEPVIFDRASRELPTAIIRPRAPSARVRAALREIAGWFGAGLAWIRPRTLPLIVAAVGMVFVLVSADYLAHEHGARQHKVPAFRVSPSP